MGLVGVVRERGEIAFIKEKRGRKRRVLKEGGKGYLLKGKEDEGNGSYEGEGNCMGRWKGSGRDATISLREGRCSLCIGRPLYTW